MGFWADVVRVGTAIATGGASEIAIAAANAEDEKRRREEELKRQKLKEQQMKQQEETGHTVAPPGASGCCARYSFDAPFLLDTQTGSVWRYDDAAKVLQK